MFSPNVKADIGGTIDHHRHPTFRHVLGELETAFHHAFADSREFDLLFVTGSGTFVNEILIANFAGHLDPCHVDGEFGFRLFEMVTRHQKLLTSNTPADVLPGVIYPAYETSLSRYNDPPLASSVFPFDSTKNKCCVADMVSAFPYYPIPDSVDVFTTVSSKQLGSYPVLGIIGVRKRLNRSEWFKKSFGSCLDLEQYFHFKERHETPHTPAIPLYVDLLETIQRFDRRKFVKTINDRRARLLTHLPHKFVTGEGPVVTISFSSAVGHALFQKFDLYQSRVGFQVFLYSGTDKQFECLCREAKRLTNNLRNTKQENYNE